MIVISKSYFVFFNVAEYFPFKLLRAVYVIYILQMNIAKKLFLSQWLLLLLFGFRSLPGDHSTKQLLKWFTKGTLHVFFVNIHVLVYFKRYAFT